MSYSKKSFPFFTTRRFFALLRLFLLLVSLEKRSHNTQIKSRAEKERRDETVLSKEFIIAHYTRKAFTLSVALRTRTHKPKYARSGTKHTHTHTLYILFRKLEWPSATEGLRIFPRRVLLRVRIEPKRG